MIPHTYTKEQHDFIVEHYKGRTTKELTDLFNTQFKVALPPRKIKGYKNRFKLWSGVVTQFGHGQVSGRFAKGSHPSPATEFKKGHAPVNHRPVGSERINIYGYIEIKIAEPNIWRQKQQVVWESINGPIPKGMVILVLDGDKTNVAIENLTMISRAEVLILNRNVLLHKDPELTKTGIMIAKILHKTYTLNGDRT